MFSFKKKDSPLKGIIKKNHKYLDRYKGKNGKWIYIYNKPKKDSKNKASNITSNITSKIQNTVTNNTSKFLDKVKNTVSSSIEGIKEGTYNAAIKIESGKKTVEKFASENISKTVTEVLDSPQYKIFKAAALTAITVARGVPVAAMTLIDVNKAEEAARSAEEETKEEAEKKNRERKQRELMMQMELEREREQREREERERGEKLDPTNRLIDSLLPKKDKRATSYEDAEKVNPNFDPYDWDDGWESNCWACTTTYDLRRRGYDVTAAWDIDGESRNNILKMYEDAELVGFTDDFQHFKITSFDTLPDNEKIDLMHEKLSQQGNGARGNLTVYWGRINNPVKTAGGHSVVYEVINNEVFIIDAQSNDIYTINEWFEDINDCGFTVTNPAYIRLDNVTPNANVLTAVDVSDLKNKLNN